MRNRYRCTAVQGPRTINLGRPQTAVSFGLRGLLTHGMMNSAFNTAGWPQGYPTPPALAHPPCKQAGPAGLGRYRRSPNHGDNAPVAKKKSTNPKLRVEYIADADETAYLVLR